MTRPTDVKPREGEQEGTLPEQFQAGSLLPELRFTVTPDVVAEYLKAIDADEAVYTINGRRAAPNNVLALYLLAVLYRKYPPIQGIILAKQEWSFFKIIWGDESTDIVARGKVLQKEERRNKTFVKWQASFEDISGSLIATATNELYVPTQKEAHINV